ncbi:MAG: hypothetical protein LH616_08455 [Ilumatobacteraceae bacterium]|nr:hypothetical protein [Ilumatobacteraceae bacterium]
MTNRSEETTDTPLVDRRGLFRLGGLSAAALAIAACSDNTEAGTVGRVGEGGTTPSLEDPVVNDGVFLRTMAGVCTSIANAYGHILDGGFLAKSSETLPDLGDQTELVKLFQEHHTAAADTFNALALEAGAEEWTCGNTRLDAASINPIFDRVENGAPATDSSKAIGPSDDPTRDYINLVHSLESMSASACQDLVPVLSQAAMRFTAMQIGVRSARQAALVALRIFPGGYVAAVGETTTAEDTATTTTAAAEGAPPAPTAIPLPVAVPARFGLLSPTTFIGGAGDQNGVRLKINFETPSLNSFTYPFYSCP